MLTITPFDHDHKQKIILFLFIELLMYLIDIYILDTSLSNESKNCFPKIDTSNG